MAIRVQHIDHVAITVRDIQGSIDWYTETLGLEHRPVIEWGSYPQMVCAGETCVALFPASVDEPRDLEEGESARTITMRHLAFRVDRENFDGAREAFAEKAVAFEFADHDVAPSLYVSDPDGHRIELTTYEV